MSFMSGCAIFSCDLHLTFWVNFFLNALSHGPDEKHDNALGQRYVLASKAQIAMENFCASLQVHCITVRILAFTYIQLTISFRFINRLVEA